MFINIFSDKRKHSVMLVKKSSVIIMISAFMMYLGGYIFINLPPDK